MVFNDLLSMFCLSLYLLNLAIEKTSNDSSNYRTVVALFSIGQRSQYR